MIKVETSENVRNSVKYLYLIAGRGIDAVRTGYKRTTDVLSTGRTWNKRSVVLIQGGMNVPLPWQEGETIYRKQIYISLLACF